jgi:hypothetical protein
LIVSLSFPVFEVAYKQSRIFQETMQTTNLWGAVPPWKNKSNIQSPLDKNMKAIG